MGAKKDESKKVEKAETPYKAWEVTMSKIRVENNIRSDGWESEDAFKELVSSIKNHGLLQPVGVIPYEGEGKEEYELTFGYRRFAACKKAGYTRIHCILDKARLSERDKLMRKLAENAHRADLSGIEEGRVFDELITVHKMQAKEIAKRRGCAEGYVSQQLQLYRSETLRDAISEGKISKTHGRELLRVKDASKQRELMEKAGDMSVGDLRGMIDKLPDEQKIQSNRGRKPKVKMENPESKLPHGLRYKDPKDVTKTLKTLDESLASCKGSGDDKKEAYFRGMIRGIGWVVGLGGGDDLTASASDLRRKPEEAPAEATLPQ